MKRVRTATIDTTATVAMASPAQSSLRRPDDRLASCLATGEGVARRADFFLATLGRVA